MTDKLLSDWPGVLAEENVPHNSDLFKYCAERNAALWAFVRAVIPEANGDLNCWVDPALKKTAALEQRVEGLEKIIADERACEECWEGKSCGSDCYMQDVVALAAEDEA